MRIRSAVFFCQVLFCFCKFGIIALTAGEKNERRTLSLTDVPQPGSQYSFQFRRLRKNSWQMKIPGISKPAAREDMLQVQTSGIVHFLESDSVHRKIEFEIGMLSAVLNGRSLCKIDSEKISQMITVRKGETPNVQLLRETTQDNGGYDTILGVETSPKKSLKADSSDEQIQRVLQFVFAFPGDSVSDYAGKKSLDLSQPEIPLNSAPIHELVRSKGLTMGTGKVVGKLHLGPLKQFRGLPVYPLSFQMESSGIPGWDFQYQMEIFYSSDDRNIPLHTRRQALEITDRALPWEDILYPGNSLQVIRIDETEINMSPWK